jgi:hypothetical protein
VERLFGRGTGPRHVVCKRHGDTCGTLQALIGTCLIHKN